MMVSKSWTFIVVANDRIYYRSSGVVLFVNFWWNVEFWNFGINSFESFGLFFLYKVPFFKPFDLYQPCYYVVKLDPLEITCSCIALKIRCWIHLWKFQYSLSLQQTFVSVLVICLFFLLGLLWLFHFILIDCVLRR